MSTRLNSTSKRISHFLSKYILSPLLVFFSISLYGQEDDSMLRREFEFLFENDALLPAGDDEYYSSGLFFRYRRLIDEDRKWFTLFNKKENLSKAIVSYEFVHKMYTPNGIDEWDPKYIDRPYAGWVYLNVGMNYHFKNNSVLAFNTDLGWLGPGTKTGEIQRWWHDKWNMSEPVGWDYQINNTPAVNFSIHYRKRLLNVHNGLDLIGEQFLQVGTIRNNARLGLTLRMGRLGSLDNSMFTNSKLGASKKKIMDIPMEKRLHEIFFFLRMNYEYVFYNTTIEGNLVGERSAFTKEAENKVFHHTWGIGRSGVWFDLLFALNFRSVEVKEAGKHAYVSIALTHRF